MSTTRTAARPVLVWRSWPQAALLICRGATLRPAARIAVVVGTLLTAVNQGTVLASGHVAVATVGRMAANVLIPYTVASIGFLAPFRVARTPAPHASVPPGTSQAATSSTGAGRPAP